MKFIMHGAAQQVGRSCIEVQTQGDRYLLDCGVRFLDDGFEYPDKVFEVKEIDGVLISHAHLDHTGALPFLEHHNLLCPVFMTSQTKAITEILLKDSFKIARIKDIHPAFSKFDLKRLKEFVRTVEMEKRYHFRKIYFTFYNAGHIPGSASILIEAEGKRVVYTGDYNTRPSNLMEPAKAENFKDIDVLITESTYGARKLPDREPLGDVFLDSIEKTIKQGGRVLIPVFAVGRAQDVLITLSRRKWDVPIYFDGMCKIVTRKVLAHNSRYVKNKNALHQMYYDRIKFVTSENMRNKVALEPGIFLCTSGMLQGGPAIHYLKHMWHDEKSAVLLTGYQVRNTNGWLLSTQKEFYLKGWRTKVKCNVERYDFSGHLSQEDLHAFIKKVNPKVLIINHGNVEAEIALCDWAKENTPAIVYAPLLGDEVDV